MLKLFGKNMGLQVLLILAVVLVLWWQPLVSPPALALSEYDGVFYGLIVKLLGGLPRLAVVIALLSVVGEAIALNLLLANAGLVPQTTLLPTLLYIVGMSAPATTLSPLVLVNAILIVFLYQLRIKGSLLTISTEKICSATALIGICTMIYLPAAAFLISYLLVAVMFRLYGWRDWAAMILGLAAPYVLLIPVLYVTNRLDWWLDATAATMGHLGINTTGGDTLSLIADIVLAAIIAVSLIGLWGKLNEKTMQWQTNASTVMLLAVGGLAMLFCTQLLPVTIAYFAIPFALCGTHLLLPERTRRSAGSKRSHNWIYDSLFILILFAALLC